MPRDVARREHARSIGLDEAVEAVLEADAFDAAVGRRLDDGADDRVQSWSVAAAGEHAESPQSRHRSTIANVLGSDFTPVGG